MINKKTKLISISYFVYNETSSLLPYYLFTYQIDQPSQRRHYCSLLSDNADRTNIHPLLSLLMAQ